MFELLPARRRSFLLPLTASVALHMLAIPAGLPVLERGLNWRFRPEGLERAIARNSRKEPLWIRIPDTPPQRNLPAVRSSKRELRRAVRPLPNSGASPGGTAGQAQPVVRASAVVLQPGAQVEPPREIPPLKTVAVWSGPNPGRVDEPITAGAAQPGIDPLQAASDRSVRGEPVAAPPRLPVPAPALPEAGRGPVYIPPSGASPVAMLRQWLQEPELPVTAATTGKPAAFVVITPERPRPGETVPVPPGNLVVLGSGTGTAPPPPDGTTQRLSVPPPARSSIARSAGPARDEPASPRLNGAPSRSDREAEPAPERASAAASAASGGSAEAASAAAGSAAAPRIIRTAMGEIRANTGADGSVVLSYPQGGAFDVVVVDAPLPEPVASSARALSGTPVYTAYLNVGLPVEWILHYCVAGGEAAVQRRHAVVTLSAPSPLKAPYVVEAHLPPPRFWQKPAHQVFHAVLNANGRLEGLRAIQTGGDADVLLDALRRWVFRPAMRDNAPTPIEVLLVIPPFRP